MKKTYLVILVLAVAMLSACGSNKTKSDDSSADRTTTGKTAATADKTTAGKAATTETAAGEIVGTPAKGSKFAKLKIGMKLTEVVALIGAPTNQSTHPTGKAHIPFYFGPDRWVYDYYYKGEGVLTINGGGDQVLTRIEVNKAQ